MTRLAIVLLVNLGPKPYQIRNHEFSNIYDLDFQQNTFLEDHHDIYGYLLGLNIDDFKVKMFHDIFPPSFELQGTPSHNNPL